MKPGDIIRERYQVNAVERVVLAKMPNGCLVVLDMKLGVRVVLPWAYDIVKVGNDRDASLAKLVLNQPEVQSELVVWLLGSQVTSV